jgi:serine/threonine-protein kinase
MYGVEATAQTLICAGIAIAGSRVVYQLTRDLSQARRMGSYELVERIGAGGMGEVWKAKHRMLVRPAAIKFIRPAALGDDGTVLRRFEREAQATSRLSSPHSVDLYDFGIADDGTLYYVMELLQGIDLKSIVERFGPMPPERTIHILRQVCHSLADAHQTGLVHRDIKPSNIYVCRSGNEYDFVKVLDFGLVKYVGAETGALEVTMEGIASGTPGYMAPEMLSDSRHVDARSDLYALGCVAYWLLTGAIVFPGESALAILLRHAKDEPPPPSSRTAQRIPGDLERFVLDCLQKAPEQRPQTATEASRRLAECARSLPSWTDERAEQTWRAHLPQFVDTEYDAHAGEPGR